MKKLKVYFNNKGKPEIAEIIDDNFPETALIIHKDGIKEYTDA